MFCADSICEPKGSSRIVVLPFCAMVGAASGVRLPEDIRTLALDPVLALQESGH